MSPVGRFGSGVHVRNGPIWPPRAPSKPGHGAAGQPVSTPLLPLPPPSVVIVTLPKGCVTLYVAFAVAPVIVTRTRMKAAGPAGGLTASWASTSLAEPPPTGTEVPALK